MGPNSALTGFLEHRLDGYGCAERVPGKALVDTLVVICRVADNE